MAQLTSRFWSHEALMLLEARTDGGAWEDSTPAPVAFTLSELEGYTDGNKKFIGRGGFGLVYEGAIPGGSLIRNLAGHNRKIAVKVSRWPNPTIRAQFEAERNYLARMEDQNIIKLIGYCETPEKLYLIYPFMPNGTVQCKLSELDWSKTLKILEGVAKAIKKLHSHEPALIYRDLKPDNILLDKDFNPKLTDFGTVTQEGEHLRYGTPGYTDPIVMNGGPGTKCNDVYSFGVVTLQLIMKEKQIMVGGKEFSQHITNWATGKKSRGGHAVNDKLLGRNGCSLRDAEGITELAFDCVQETTEQRPTITQVLDRLSLLDGGHSRSRKIMPLSTNTKNFGGICPSKKNLGGILKHKSIRERY